MEFALVLAILFFSIVLHEVSHGAVALLNGDPTARDAGRLTLNPLPHVDLMGTIVLPAILLVSQSGVLFGWAKPVPFDPRRFRDRNTGLFTVGLAGPATNLVLAVAASLAFKALPPEGGVLPRVLYTAVWMNVLLAFFNLLPIPPLDGSRAVGAFLSPAQKRAYYAVEPFGFLILIALLFSGVFRATMLPFCERVVFLLTGVA
jgi:Zn-dependent protease